MEKYINQIINADCLEILKELPDKSVDFVMTDPPYGMNYHSGHYKNGNPHKKIVGDNEYPANIIPLLKRKARKGVFAFCRWDNLREVEQPDSFIVWVKNNWSAGDLNKEFGRMWEGILFYALEDFKFNRRIPDVIESKRISAVELKHPTEKPVNLMKKLIEYCTQPDDIILDPFAGSGSTLVAAAQLNRKYIGVEIESLYVKTIQYRLANLQQHLFN
jgi:DNA modification methylase